MTIKGDFWPLYYDTLVNAKTETNQKTGTVPHRDVQCSWDHSAPWQRVIPTDVVGMKGTNNTTDTWDILVDTDLSSNLWHVLWLCVSMEVHEYDMLEPGWL